MAFLLEGPCPGPGGGGGGGGKEKERGIPTSRGPSVPPREDPLEKTRWDTHMRELLTLKNVGGGECLRREIDYLTLHLTVHPYLTGKKGVEGVERKRM